MTRTSWLLTALAVVFATSVIFGAVTAWIKYHRNVAVEILLPEPKAVVGTIYITGGVAAPGAFPFTADDTIGDLLSAAGGIGSQAELTNLQLSVASKTEASQKVDINRADAWLLEALPGIGEVIAQRIVDYRRTNGPFANTVDLTRVSGLGRDTYEKIKALITVGGG